MRVVVDGRGLEGRGVDLRDVPVGPGTVVAAVFADGPVDGVRVRSPSPGPLHDELAHVEPSPAASLRGALAAAARSRGERAPEREALVEARAALAAHEVPTVDLEAERRRTAEAGGRERELSERVAGLRGRVQALREAGLDASEAEAELREAVRALSEAETERVAAEQRLDSLRAAASEARDARRRRLALQDRVSNLERAARRSLAERLYAEFRAAVAAVPGEGDAGGAPGEYEGDPATAALAVVRVASPAAPVVVSVDRFDDAATAARRLDAPVVLARSPADAAP